jgi:hypothetical protein
MVLQQLHKLHQQALGPYLTSSMTEPTMQQPPTIQFLNPHHQPMQQKHQFQHQQQGMQGPGV